VTDLEEVQSCRSEEGITVGLVDAVIGILRVLAPRDLSPKPVQEALADLFEDPDLRTVQDARQVDQASALPTAEQASDEAPKCGVINPRQAATCIDPPRHDDDHHDAFGHAWARRPDDKPLFPQEYR
jgi:hypothetical protein